MEEVEDEYWAFEGRMPKARRHVLEDADDWDVEEEIRTDDKNEENVETHEQHESQAPPSSEAPPTVVLRAKRKTKPGNSAVGVSVLSIRGWIESTDNLKVDLRMDSCADITLISEEYIAAMKNAPKIRAGRLMNLAQLTDKGTQISGYAKLKILMESLTGELLEMEAEGYVVKGMTAPILLGEDFQLTYEIGVSRNVEEGCKITFNGLPFEVKAEGVEPFPDAPEVNLLSTMLATHAEKAFRSKVHRRAKARRRKKKLAMGLESRTIRAAEDYRIKAHEVKLVRVVGDFSEDREWLVEKALLPNADESFFTVPNVLISARKPVVPVANASDRPRFIRKGEAIGTITDPQEFFDKPSSEKCLRDLQEQTDHIKNVIQATFEATEGREDTSEAMSEEGESEVPCTSEEPSSKFPVHEKSRNTKKRAHIRTNTGTGMVPTDRVRVNMANGVHTRTETGEVPSWDGRVPATEDGAREAEDYGPKTAAMPELTEYPSAKMKELLDIGSLPEHLKERAWRMLEKRIGAFGFDGRLGHVAAKARIRTKLDQEPIAVPMYGSSPEKRRVIDAQLDKWFEQGVIEPSISPWSAPVVIAYRNGKPRFCVDYRKLNVVTVADEFPIPRQSEILSSLSGAQCMSSLDALAGFTQIEVDREDVEKTAFRTHRGLAQFTRMPFGL
jgi:hypothetical protein